MNCIKEYDQIRKDIEKIMQDLYWLRVEHNRKKLNFFEKSKKKLDFLKPK